MTLSYYVFAFGNSRLGYVCIRYIELQTVYKEHIDIEVLSGDIVWSIFEQA